METTPVAGQTPFTPDTDVRIKARNDAARAHIATRTGLGKFTAQASLFLANAVDRTHALFANADAALLSGAMFGAFRGALMGLIIASFIPFFSFPLVVGGMATLFAAHDGFGEYNHARSHDPRTRGAKWADWIATKGGAIGGPSVAMPTPDGEFRHAKHQAHMDHEVAAALQRAEAKDRYAQPALPAAEATTPTNTQPDATLQETGAPGSFVARENARRGLAPTTASPTAGEARFTETLERERSNPQQTNQRPVFV